MFPEATSKKRGPPRSARNRGEADGGGRTHATYDGADAHAETRMRGGSSCRPRRPVGVSMAAERKTKLSKNLLRMKFMQRGLDSETKKQLEEEEKKIISEEHWYLDLPELKEKESFIIEEQSFLLCEDLLYGRMSFRGFNPEVEKLMLQMNTKNKAEEVEEQTVELDVSDEEMARRYETLVGTIGKKFAKKRDRAIYEEDENGDIKPVKAKKMFLKPQD